MIVSFLAIFGDREKNHPSFSTRSLKIKIHFSSNFFPHNFAKKQPFKLQKSKRCSAMIKEVPKLTPTFRISNSRETKSLIYGGHHSSVNPFALTILQLHIQILSKTSFNTRHQALNEFPEGSGSNLSLILSTCSTCFLSSSIILSTRPVRRSFSFFLRALFSSLFSSTFKLRKWF